MQFILRSPPTPPHHHALHRHLRPQRRHKLGQNDEWITGGKWNNDHDQVSFTTQTGDKGECLTVPLMKGMGPERKDYEFVGWYTAAAGGKPVEEQSYYASNQHLEPITDNITLYAHWQWNGEGPEPVLTLPRTNR